MRLLLTVLSAITAMSIATRALAMVEKPSLPPALQESWSAFLAEQKIGPEFKAALTHANQRYVESVIELGEKSVACKGKTVDVTWYERAVAKFGAADVKKFNRDFTQSIGSLYLEKSMRCKIAAEKDALYAEFQLLPFLNKELDLLKEYRRSLDKSQVALLNPIVTYLTQIRDAHPTPLQGLLEQTWELQDIEKRAAINQGVWEFVASDPAFQKPFALTKALEPLKKER